MTPLFLSTIFVSIINGVICIPSIPPPPPPFDIPPPPPFGPAALLPPPHNGHFPFPPPPGPPIPEFLMDVSEKAHREHLQLFLESEGKTKSELKKELEKWAINNGVKEEFDKFMAEHEKRRSQYHDLIMANLAGDALAAFNKIWAILENDQISRTDECQQIRQVTDQLKVKIRDLIPHMAPKIPGPPPHGCFPLPPFPPPFSGPPPQFSKMESSTKNDEQKA